MDNPGLGILREQNRGVCKGWQGHTDIVSIRAKKTSRQESCEKAVWRGKGSNRVLHRQLRPNEFLFHSRAISDSGCRNHGVVDDFCSWMIGIFRFISCCGATLFRTAEQLSSEEQENQLRSSVGGIFLSRTNYSCRPNTQHTWNSSTNEPKLMSLCAQVRAPLATLRHLLFFEKIKSTIFKKCANINNIANTYSRI